MDLIFATNNSHKLLEVRNLLGKSFKILSLKDINISEEIPENQNTIEGNASQKAFYIYNRISNNANCGEHLPLIEGGCWGCFADDTGLEIEALNGRPGVFSARYAGEHCNFEDNMNKVLMEMENEDNRKARFRTVISYIINGEEKLFEGVVNGIILKEKRGEKGFGYDPFFLPDGYNVSFAEMSLEEKNTISHRAIAIKKLSKYLFR